MADATNRLPHLLAALADLLSEGEPVYVRIERAPLFAELRVGSTSASPQPLAVASRQTPDGTPRQQGTMFSPIEQAILNAATHEWQTAGVLADKVGQKSGQWFYAILGNLVDRGWLDSSRNGYRLPDADA